MRSKIQKDVDLLMSKGVVQLMAGDDVMYIDGTRMNELPKRFQKVPGKLRLTREHVEEISTRSKQRFQ